MMDESKINIDTNGYPYIYMPEHSMANRAGKIYIHRLVMSEHLGRDLESDEWVHHIDENKLNYSIDNLELTNNSDHATYHHPSELKEIDCEFCGKTFKQRKITMNFCSAECNQLSRRRFIINEDVLRRLVWLMPTTKIAKIFNVSDVAVAKRCKLLGIEKPSRGYWTKYNKK